MIRMLWTRWPARIHERVMKTLLNVVDNTLLEVGRIISEYSDPSDRFLDGWLVTAPDSFDEIMHKEPKHAICVSLRNQIFPTPSGDIARRAVRYAVPNQDVPPTEHLMAHDAEAAPSVDGQLITALRTGTGRVALPHVLVS
jgi:hypothetical protein